MYVITRLGQTCSVPCFRLITLAAALNIYHVVNYMFYRRNMSCHTTERINLSVTDFDAQKTPNDKTPVNAADY